MIRYLIIILSLVLVEAASPQSPVGTWMDHLSYNSATNIAAGENIIYASTGSSIISYNRSNDELNKITRVQGLSETGIGSICYSRDYNSLIISYLSTNIDLVINNTVYNIADVKRKYIPGKKQFYRIKSKGKYAYLAGSFGIVVVDLVKREIYDTWKPGSDGVIAEVYDISFGPDKIYAATSSGIYYAALAGAGLSYYGNWNKITSLRGNAASYNAILATGSKIFVNRSQPSAAGDSVFVIENGASLFSYQPGVFNKFFDAYNGGFTISSQGSIRIFNDSGSLLRTISSYGSGTPNISQAIVDGSDIWIADVSSGFIKGENLSSLTFRSLTLPGPYTNNIINISSTNGKTFIAGGGVNASWTGLYLDMQVFSNENNSWNSIISSSVKDAMRVIGDPNNNNHFFVATWGFGLLEYENNALINKYDDSNSPLQTIIPGQPYSRICGLAFDKSGNLWIAQSGLATGTLHILKRDKTWKTFPMPINGLIAGDILISKSGYKWITLPRGPGLFILDDNNTPENFNDDRYKILLVKDADGNVLSNVFSIAEDLDGNIWVGTDQGPAVYYNTNQVFDQDPRAYRIIIPRNDGTGLGDYLLKSETITSIAIDGANRKWIGTTTSGAYLLSPDGLQKLVNYTEDNSPLYSNNIVSLAIDGKSGEVWFGTSKGVISERGDATAGGEEFKNVYTFPDPVRSGYTGNVTITGLMRDTRIKITDISGNLVYETMSDGGQATWNLTNYKGERVATGVYIVFCASPDGKATAVTKMLVIK
jgi:hypothetical protein